MPRLHRHGDCTTCAARWPRGLQRLGVRFEVTEAVLNHVSGSKGGVAGVYQRYDWAVEKAHAVQAWADHVSGLLTGADQTNVVQLSEVRA